jgi:hypothetical protein
VQIRASVVGAFMADGITQLATQPIAVTPNATTSSLDAAIVIGGSAGSVAFGQAARIVDAGGTSTVYTFPMSVLVADANGSPAPLGTVVNISAWPIAWTTGSSGFGCSPDPDGEVYVSINNTLTAIAGNGGTFLNEDINENLVLDANEDGLRKFYATGTATAASGYTVPTGTKDNQITPLNSWGGTVVSTNPADLPGTATTDATGLATFNLTYTKSSAYWITTRIRAQTLVQGSPAVGQLYFQMGPSKADTDPDCFLPPSPFAF